MNKVAYLSNSTLHNKYKNANQVFPIIFGYPRFTAGEQPFSFKHLRRFLFKHLNLVLSHEIIYGHAYGYKKFSKSCTNYTCDYNIEETAKFAVSCTIKIKQFQN